MSFDTEPGAEQSGAVMAYVFFYDIVGSSKLTTDAARAVTARLQDVVRKLPHFERATANNQLVSIPTGDGAALVFLGDMNDPVDCAIGVAEALNRDPFCKLRMGLHAGPVFIVEDINDRKNVSGAGINRCERVMSSGDAGHILLSDSFADSLRQFSRWREKIHDIGPCKTKDGRLNLFSLYEGDIGNPIPPAKSERAQHGKRRVRMGIAAALVVAIAGASGGIVYSNMDRRPVRSLKYSMLVKAPNAEPMVVAREMLFPPGYKLKIQVESQNPGHLYIINEGPVSAGVGTWSWLFPVKQAELGQPLPANTKVTIPDAPEAWIEVDRIRGKESVYFIWSEQPVDALAEAFKALSSRGEVAAASVPALREIIQRYHDSAEVIKGESATEIRGRSQVTVARIVLEHL